jgi:hypothetical protein
MRREESEDVRVEIGPLTGFFHNISWANGETADNSLVVERLGSDVLPRGVISKRLSDMVDA